MTQRFIVALMVLFVVSGHTRAVVISSGDGSGNTTAPGDDPGWSYIGRTNNALTGIYLGNRWMLTARHAGNITSITLPIGTFSIESGTGVRLKNPTGLGLSEFTDLKVYRLTTDPGLSDLTIRSTPAPLGGEITLIGNGRNRLAPLKHWSLSMSDQDWVWTDEVSSPPGDISGFALSSSRTMRWGTNVIEDDTTVVPSTDANHQVIVKTSDANGHVISLLTRFDENGTASEAQAAVGDSGGGVFYKNGSQWELVGIMHAIELVHDQPDNHAILANSNITSIPSGSITFFADLSVYRGQIAEITGVPEPSSLLLAALGIVILAMWGRRWRRPHR